MLENAAQWFAGEWGHQVRIFLCYFSLKQRLLSLSLKTRYNIKTWDVTGSGDLVSTFRNGHRGRVNDFLLVNERTLVSASSDNSIIVWNITTQSRILTLLNHNDTVRVLKMLDKSLMVSGSHDGQIILWNLTVTTPTPSGHDHFVASFSNHTSEIGYALGVVKMRESALMSSRRVLVSGARDQFINIWNVNTGQLMRQIATGKDVFALTVIESRGAKLG